MTAGILLAIDGGGTATRCVAVSRDGAVLGHAEGGPSNDLQVGWETARASIEGVVDEALRSGGLRRADVAALAAGLAGVDADGTGAARWAAALEGRGLPRAFVHGDMIAAHRGALAGAPGVVALAGTGSTVVGIGEDGRVAKVGGWGPIYGNEGSAYWIGREGLRAAARAWDGRGPGTRLVDALADALGVRTFDRSIDAVYAGPMGQQEIAALAPRVYALAEAGDEAAAAICDAAAAGLAEAARAAVRRMGAAARTEVSWQGAVLRSCHRIRAAFEARLREDEPALDVHPPMYEPVIGAFLLGCRALDWDPSAALRRIAASQDQARAGSGRT